MTSRLHGQIEALQGHGRNAGALDFLHIVCIPQEATIIPHHSVPNPASRKSTLTIDPSGTENRAARDTSLYAKYFVI